ncbi:CAP domain-containing protein [Terrabacter sp. NPDC000476]|uniref:CAP domain-containing protein n=1 Tax=Terrabacter sp. NPDC000476 TaxID=3154258 RepID=UPI00332FB623
MTTTTTARSRVALVLTAAAALTAVPSVAATPSADAATVSVQNQVITLVNAQRAKAGCRALVLDARLSRAAQAHSIDMAKRRYFSHTTPDGRTFAQRIRAQGYTGSMIGENIAAGQPTPRSVMDAWMKSPGHRANILDCRYRAIGVGAAVGGPYRYYWTQDFGG